MIISNLQRLSQESTYQDLALRCQEFLYYQSQGQSDLRQLAEDMLFNLLVEYLVDTGLPRDQAELFCGDRANLTELAMRIGSILGPAVA